jgi:hypothetical protein
MQFMLLIYTDEKEWEALSDEKRNSLVREYFALTDELRAQGSYVAGAPLRPTTTAVSVRVQDGREIVTDGPFAETKEQLGGYFLIEADSIDEARRWATRIPAARYGTIEVRPVLPVGAEVPAG